MGGGDWKDSGYRRPLGRTEDLRTSHMHKLQELGGFLSSAIQAKSCKLRALGKATTPPDVFQVHL